MVAACLLILEFLVLAVWLRRHDDSGVAQLANDLGLIEERVQSGELDWAPPDGVRLDDGLADVVESAWREGAPLAASLRAMQHMLIASAHLWRRGRALSGIFFGRGVVGFGVAGLARVVIVTMGVDSARHGRLDQAALLGAGAMFLSATWLCNAHLPTSWLWERASPSSASAVRSTAKARAWLMSHLSGDYAEGSPAASEIEELAYRELASGVSLRDEKRRRLTKWAANETHREERRLDRLTDLLPLLELLGIGAPAALVLAVPISNWLA